MSCISAMVLDVGVWRRVSPLEMLPRRVPICHVRVSPSIGRCVSTTAKQPAAAGASDKRENRRRFRAHAHDRKQNRGKVCLQLTVSTAYINIIIPQQEDLPPLQHRCWRTNEVHIAAWKSCSRRVHGFCLVGEVFVRLHWGRERAVRFLSIFY